jgi:hypothetical protein
MAVDYTGFGRRMQETRKIRGRRKEEGERGVQ